MTMRSLSLLARVVPVAAAVLVAACDGGGTEPNPRLKPADVAGVYKVCTLTFRPIQAALPEADLLSTVIDEVPPAPKQAPSLTLSGTTATYQLVYTRLSDSFSQQLQGSVTLGSTALNVNFGEEGQVRRELLLPGVLNVNYSAVTKQLTALGETVFSVRRADYAYAAGITEEGLQDRINGSVYAVFSQGSCG